MRLDFAALVDDSGALKPADPMAWRVGISRLSGKPVHVTIQTRRRPRSRAENNYYFGVVLTMIGLETGHTPEEVHDSAPVVSLRRVLDSRLGWIVRSTTTFSTVEMEDYLTEVRAWAASFLGLIIPLPNESIEVSL